MTIKDESIWLFNEKKFLYLPFTFVPKYLLSFVENPESNLSNYFSPFESIKLQIIKSNEFRTNPIFDNLTPTSVVGVESNELNSN